MAKIRIRTHPGEVLLEDCMKPLGLSAHKLAAAIGVTPNRVSQIVAQKRSVTADTALRLARFWGTTPEFWLNLQAAHDLSKAEAEHKGDYAKIKTREIGPAR